MPQWKKILPNESDVTICATTSSMWVSWVNATPTQQMTTINNSKFYSVGLANLPSS